MSISINDIQVDDIFDVKTEDIIRYYGSKIQIVSINTLEDEVCYRYIDSYNNSTNYSRSFEGFLTSSDFDFSAKEINIDTSPLFEDFDL